MSSHENKGLAGHNSSLREGVLSKSADHSDEVTYSASTPDKSLEKPHDYAAAEKSITDEESANIGQIASDENEVQKSFLAIYYRRYRAYIHIFIWLVFTA